MVGVDGSDLLLGLQISHSRSAGAGIENNPSGPRCIDQTNRRTTRSAGRKGRAPAQLRGRIGYRIAQRAIWSGNPLQDDRLMAHHIRHPARLIHFLGGGGGQRNGNKGGGNRVAQHHELPSCLTSSRTSLVQSQSPVFAATASAITSCFALPLSWND